MTRTVLQSWADFQTEYFKGNLRGISSLHICQDATAGWPSHAAEEICTRRAWYLMSSSNISGRLRLTGLFCSHKTKLEHLYSLVLSGLAFWACSSRNREFSQGKTGTKIGSNLSKRENQLIKSPGFAPGPALQECLWKHCHLWAVRTPQAAQDHSVCEL